jgi:hypothetical protein
MQCGRTLPLAARVQHTQLLKRAVAVALSPVDDAEYARSMIALRAKSLAAGDPVAASLELEQCMLGCMCYYPDDPGLVERRERYWAERLAQTGL